MLDKVDVLVIGGGMYAREVILPALFQEKRYGRVGNISLCSRRVSTVKKLSETFPLHKVYPDPGKYGIDEKHPDMYKQAINELPDNTVVFIATPDHFHMPVMKEAIRAGKHMVVEKPTCLKVGEAHELIKESDEKGIYILTDFHKRHDRSIRAARYRYRQGMLGEMLHGHAWIEQTKYMALEVFREWLSDSFPFACLGVHYTDAYYYITGLLPKRLVALGQKKYLSSLNIDAYDSIQAMIEWEDSSVFYVQTAWVSNSKNSATPNQGMQLLGTNGEYWSDHKDRNLHFVTDEKGYEDYNPNFFKEYDSWDFPGETDYVGYGYDSIVQGVNDIRKIIEMTSGMTDEEALLKRRALIREMEDTRALPRQALISVAVIDAVRMSAENGGKPVVFDENMNPEFE